MVFAHADIRAWVKFGAALADDDVARNDNFTAEFLDAKTATG